MRFTGGWFQILLFLTGVALGLLSSYYLFRGVYRMVGWSWTTGIITGTVFVETSEDYAIHEKAQFVDPAGDTIEVISFAGVTHEDDARTGEVTILYNPKNTREATILQFRDFLIVLFLPFALLLVFLGWPFESDSKNQKPVRVWKE
jgi:hypothetical protein